MVAIDNKIEQAMVSLCNLKLALSANYTTQITCEYNLFRRIHSEKDQLKEKVASVSAMNGLHNHVTSENWEVMQHTAFC